MKPRLLIFALIMGLFFAQSAFADISVNVVVGRVGVAWTYTLTAASFQSGVSDEDTYDFKVYTKASNASITNIKGPTGWSNEKLDGAPDYVTIVHWWIADGSGIDPGESGDFKFDCAQSATTGEWRATGTSDWESGGIDVPLPVELSSFTASTDDGTVTLRWRTESEVNNAGFAIYRSDAKDGQYTKIGWRHGAGNSAFPLDYQFLDKKVEVGKTYFYYIEGVGMEGMRDESDIIQIAVIPQLKADLHVERPMNFYLSQNYPNPFNPATTIAYDLPEASDVTLTIYSATGQKMATVVSAHQEVGHYEVIWDGRDDTGRDAASGVYLYYLEVEGQYVQARRMILLR